MKLKSMIFIPEGNNIPLRLKELPHAAWKRVNPEALGLTRVRFYKLINREYDKIRSEELERFCELLKCTPEEFFDPTHAFQDFRTEKQKLQDLNPRFLLTA